MPGHGERDLAAGAQLGSPVPRRRPLRTQSASNDYQSASSLWVETDQGDLSRKVRATPRRSSKISPQSITDTHPPLPIDNAAPGFFPKLSRIVEGKENKPHRRHWSSTADPEDESKPARRRRSAENATLSRRPIRQKQGSLQRRVESLVSLQNPSLISVLSGVTQQSNVSGGSNDSNTTITQQSYDRSQLVKHKPTKVRKRLQAKRGPPPARAETMEAHPSGVFQYLNGSLPSEQFNSRELHAADRPSTSYSSSSATSHETEDDNLSSNGDEGPEVESPLTSPASMRRPHHQDSHDEDDDSGSGMSVREASPVSHHQPSVSDDMEDSDGHEERSPYAQGNEDESSEYSDDDDQDNASATDELAHQQHNARHMALERIPPPRLPSTSSSSRNSDRHARRLRRQEQALSEHVLQAPRPQRDFHFVGGPSPQTLPPHPGMPLYDPYMHSGASPATFYATAHQGPPPVPPPPHVGYYSPPQAPSLPYSPGYDNSMVVATHPPMAPPNAMVPVPPPPHPAHPPHYQVHPTGPDLSRTTVVGYELLANKLSEGSKVEHRRPEEDTVVPMYRKFEQLNHRVLLHLQDEISELEEELRYLDECIAQCSPRNGAGLAHPASRRGDARYGSEAHFRRTELLGRIYLKLGQYSMSRPRTYKGLQRARRCLGVMGS